MFANTLPLQFSPHPLVLRPLLVFQWVAGLLFCSSVRCFRCVLGVPVPSGMSPWCLLAPWYCACNVVLCSQLVPVLMSFHGSLPVVLHRVLCSGEHFVHRLLLLGCLAVACILHASFCPWSLCPSAILGWGPFSLDRFLWARSGFPVTAVSGPGWLWLLVSHQPSQHRYLCRVVRTLLFVRLCFPSYTRVFLTWCSPLVSYIACYFLFHGYFGSMCFFRCLHFAL